MRFLPKITLAAVVSLSTCLVICAGIASGVSALPYIPNVEVRPFATMPVPNYAMVDGATVSIEAGYAAGFDRLLFTYEGNFQITQRWDTLRGTLFLSGMATVSEYASAIQMVTFLTTAEDAAPRRVTWSFGNNTIYNSLTQHYYRWTAFPIAQWEFSQAQCAGTPLLGMQGYLATITSSDEHDILSSKLPSNAWIGAKNTDALTNTWVWQTGPEAGTAFWMGGSMYVGGMVASPRSYAAWDRFQPISYIHNTSEFLPSDRKYAAYATKTTAAAMWQAMTNDAGGPNGYLCEYGGMDTPSIAATYSWYGGATTVTFACSSLATNFSCGTYASLGCSWNGAACQSTTCAVYTDERGCSSDWRCTWETSGLLIGVCANTICSRYSDAPTCKTDVRCNAVASATGATVCVPARCSEIGSACDCAKVQGCAWQEGRCFNAATLSCTGSDVVFVIDGSAAMAQPFQLYSSGFQGLIDVLRRAPLALSNTGAGQSVAGSFGMRVGVVQFGARAVFSTGVTGLHSEWQNALNYQIANFGASLTSNVNDALTEAVSMLNTADAASRNKVVIVVAANGIADATQLAAASDTPSSLANLKSAGVKVIGVVLNATMPQNPWSWAAQQSLQAMTPNLLSEPLDWFTNDVIIGLCQQGNPWGVYAVPTSLPCASIPMATCASNAQCAWSIAANACIDSACQTNCPSTCSAATACKPSTTETGRCESLCPGLAGDACLFTYASYCNWNVATSVCTPKPCVNNPSEDACIADTAACVWNPTWPVKCQPTPCSATNQSQCNAMTFNGNKCTWPNGGSQCVIDVCSPLITFQQCSANRQCAWNQAAAACRMSTCGLLSAESACSADQSCVWNTAVTPAVCSPAPCTQYNALAPSQAQSGCTADSGCAWVMNPIAGSMMCMRKTCDQQTTSCACATMPNQCVWRGGACLDNRFVQCPSVDVLFLVEATYAMNNDFGRHPDGFAGVIANLRAWGRDAPMVTSGPGFRAGIGLYGVGAQFGTNTFQGTVSSFLQDLASMLTQQPTYAATAGTGVQIMPSLQEASKQFGLLSGSRQKVLIILGSSQITDVDRSIVDTIQGLRTNGVQLFSNVLTRFSEVTPADMIAGAYLAPLATEPTELHFQYTNIDSFRPTILDGICDPSTIVGQALQISRDGVLPCPWLSGSTECNMQPSCNFAPSASATCPLPGQCANLGCLTLPASLAADFSCNQCTVRNGAVACSTATNSRPRRTGACQISSCPANCGGASGCPSTTCSFDSTRSQCVQNLCPSTLSRSDCNAKLGCVYDEVIAGGPMCRVGTCTGMRSATSCGGKTGCNWFAPASPPPVCVESRCVFLTQTTCTAQVATCDYAASSASCSDRVCTYPSGSDCQLDTTCYWNPFVAPSGTCNARTPDCAISKWSTWSSCSSNCGNAIRMKTRKVLQLPAGNGKSCSEVAATGCNPATDPNCDAVEDPAIVSFTGFVFTKPCAGLPDCTAYCTGLSSNVFACMGDNACQWLNAQCVPKPFTGCAQLSTATACAAADSCLWNTVTSFCDDAILACPYNSASDCAAASSECNWNTGSDATTVATARGISQVTLVSPGEVPVFVFPTVSSLSSTMINGATVIIESGYQRGKDTLMSTSPLRTVTATWSVANGLLTLSGQASISDYAAVINGVMFQTFSLSTTPRVITWSYGAKTVYSSVTGHFYKAVSMSGVTWAQAALNCAAESFSAWSGLQGYLASVQSADENSVVSTKLGGEGWLGGDDSSRTAWQWQYGPGAPLRFWLGGANGVASSGAYANWNAGEPATNVNPGSNRAYLNASGYWSSKPSDFAQSVGYVCEFGGMLGDALVPSMQINGSTVIGVGGCTPKTACSWHKNQGNCSMDAACRWSSRASMCVQSCSTRSTLQSCAASNGECAWDTSVLPAVCDVDICSSLGSAACGTASRCSWSATSQSCVYKTGCAAKLNQAACMSLKNLCGWTGSATNGTCGNLACSLMSTQDACSQNSNCIFENGACASAICRASTQSMCTAPQCTWGGSADNATVAFVPQGSSVQVFRNAPRPNDASTIIDGITVMITTGFSKGFDVLSVQLAPEQQGLWTVTYNSNGVLVMRPAVGNSRVTAIQGFNVMQQSVFFSTLSPSTNPRSINYALSANSVFSSTLNAVIKNMQSDSYSTFDQALAACNSATLFGVAGQLAYINNENDDLALRALGAFGWFGAAALQTTNTWTWTQSSTAAGNVSFWTVKGALGAPVATANGGFMFARWAAGQPNDASTGSQFAYFQASGSWRSLAAGSPSAGVICMFPAPSTVTIASSIGVVARGCFVTPCLSLTQGACTSTPQCTWNAVTSMCQINTWCSSRLTPSDCRKYELCNWDYDNSVCSRQPPNSCSSSTNNVACGSPASAALGCIWNSKVIGISNVSGTCELNGCGVFSLSSACSASATCIFQQGSCVSRTCGYLSSSACWADNRCQWKASPPSCAVASCAKVTTSAACSADPSGSCLWNTTTSTCGWSRCSSSTLATCLQDTDCLFKTGRCSMPDCSGLMEEKKCNADPKCFFFVDAQLPKCRAAQCTSYTAQTECEPAGQTRKVCIWTGESCRQATTSEMYAAAVDTCTQEVQPNLWWLWLCLVIIFFLILGICYRLYLAHSKGLNFMEPTRNTSKFSPHAQYAADLFEEAKETAVETNYTAGGKPSLNDL